MINPNESEKLAVEAFVEEMNKVSKSVFNLQNTVFTNPHGLGDIRNKSTVSDICVLASIVGRDKFLDIVSTQKHTAQYYSGEKEMEEATLKWTNTNKLLSTKIGSQRV